MYFMKLSYNKCIVITDIPLASKNIVTICFML